MAKAERMQGFAVTYDITTHESAEHGDYDEAGYILESCTLREAVEAVGGWAEQHDGCMEWFTNYEYDEDYQTGNRETRYLHLPANATQASRRRISRLLGVCPDRNGGL